MIAHAKPALAGFGRLIGKGGIKDTATLVNRGESATLGKKE